MILYFFIGIVVVFVVKCRGNNFNFWLGFGLLGGIIVLIVVFLLFVKNLD